MNCFKLGLLALLFAFSTVNAQERSLYHDLGETAGIEQLMEDMLIYSLEDPRIRHHFENVDMIRLHEKLVEQICEISGGDCVYSGDDMVTSHTGMNLTNTDFNALVEALQRAMDDSNVSVRAQNRLLSLLAAMHGEVVGH
ncbi:group I truncated hemoglobin [Aliidiomarina sanyensis]|uniref:Group 1 truncated hemoglobin n=1 Tax=Aliidiomarina sanyensis TaxID=1249555 RepID=A0A432WEP9_9GAMM|nr:group 1 truncated hemoglobin [Aliidiomarina sanyensis]RUO31367.1 group 1 truncated hemoglobin [Aliidiomarina sanyensis]